MHRMLSRAPVVLALPILAVGLAAGTAQAAAFASSEPAPGVVVIPDPKDPEDTGPKIVVGDLPISRR